VQTVQGFADPTLNAGADQSICAGTPITLNATSNGAVTWNNGVSNNVAFTPSVDGQYIATATLNGCTSKDTVQVTVKSNPTVNAGADQSICAGTPITLNATSNGAVAWNNGVSNNVAFTPSVGGQYIATSTLNGCTSKDTVSVTVKALPSVVVNQSGNIFTAQQSGASYQWYTSGTSYSIVAGATAQQYTATASGNYSVQITLNGCKDTSAIINYTSTGIAIHQAFDQAVSVYPNPSTDIVQVSGVRLFHFVLYNSTGEVITTGNAHSGSISLFGLSSGKYYLYIQDAYDEEKITVKGIIKQ